MYGFEFIIRINYLLALIGILQANIIYLIVFEIFNFIKQKCPLTYLIETKSRYLQFSA